MIETQKSNNMKNQNIYNYAILLFLSIVLIPWKTAQAQPEFGIKGGPLFTGWRYDYNGLMFDTQTKTGISAGVFYRINNLLGPVHLQAEFLYQLKGAKTFISYNPGSLEYNPYGYGYNPYGYGVYSGAYGYGSKYGPWMTGQENYHYFSIPVLASVTVFKVMDIYGGPEIGCMFSHSGNQTLNYGEMKKFSSGISTGLAIHLGVNTKLDLRYSTDFTTVSEATTEFRNQSFAFTVQQTLFRKQNK